MRSRLLRAFGVPALVCTCALSVAPVAAAASVADAKATVKAVAKTPAVTVKAPLPLAGGAVGARATSIMGAAWKSDNTPIPAAKLRLRNVLTGRIEATTVANDLGRFTFNEMESGSYVVELVSDSGKILAIGHTFTVAPGETVATFVRLGTKAPWFNGFFGNASSAVASVAASTGVTAVAPEQMACASPPCSR
jgi:hypothetical protein